MCYYVIYLIVLFSRREDPVGWDFVLLPLYSQPLERCLWHISFSGTMCSVNETALNRRLCVLVLAAHPLL